jgi:RNA polymerase sigma factor (sigma-70 family)
VRLIDCALGRAELSPILSLGGNKKHGETVIAFGDKERLARFEQCVLPHLDGAYNLARWLTRNPDDAQDMVQEAYLRAFKFFDTLRGADTRAWLLTIVRNTCYTWLQHNRPGDLATPFDEDIHSREIESADPASLVLKNASEQMLKQALEELPAEFREVVVLRDLEGFSYKEIALIAKVPTGTVMSRLARARRRLKELLCNRLKER